MRHEAKMLKAYRVRRFVSSPRIVVLAMLVLVLPVASMTSCERSRVEQQKEAAGGLTASLLVEPFETTGTMPKGWIPAAFAESLSVQLSTLRGLTVRAVGSDADFTLNGSVTMREGRLVISPRLQRKGEQKPVWTATFWRSEGLMHDLAQDIASGAAEALYADIAHRALTTSKERQ